MKTTIIKTVFVAATLPLLAGCVVYSEPPRAAVVVDDPTPPPLQYEVQPPCPDPTFIWIGGDWVWRGSWVWVGGRWAPPAHPGAVWIRGGWGYHGHRRVWVGAHWR